MQFSLVSVDINFREFRDNEIFLSFLFRGFDTL